MILGLDAGFRSYLAVVRRLGEQLGYCGHTGTSRKKTLNVFKLISCRSYCLNYFIWASVSLRLLLPLTVEACHSIRPFTYWRGLSW